MTGKLTPATGTPFQGQSPEFRLQEYVSTVAGFVLADRSDLPIAAKIEWFATHAVNDHDAAMRPAVRDAVTQRLVGESAENCTCRHGLHEIAPARGCFHPGCPCRGYFKAEGSS